MQETIKAGDKERWKAKDNELKLRAESLDKREQFLLDEEHRLSEKNVRLKELQQKINLDLQSANERKAGIDAEVQSKLAAREAILNEREKALAEKAQDLNKKLSEYSDEKNMFDAAKNKNQSEKAYYDKFFEDATKQLAEAHKEADARNSALDIKIVEQNKRQAELDAREKIISEKEFIASAQAEKADSLLNELRDERLRLSSVDEKLDKARQDIAAQLQASDARLEKAQAIEKANEEKDIEFAKRETVIASNLTELKKQKAEFFSEQKSIGNDNQVKSRLLDEKIKSANALRADLDRQKEELDLLKTETLKNI